VEGMNELAETMPLDIRALIAAETAEATGETV
jgi:hypothetical protein